MNKTIDVIVPEQCYSMVDCWEAIMTIMLNYYKKDHSVIYSSLDFYYDIANINNEIESLKNIFYNTFSLSNENIIEDILQFYEQFLRIKIDLVEKTTIDEMMDEIKTQIEQDKLVTVFIDTFFCKFNRMYNKFNYSHAIIICGVEDNSLLILDPTQHLEMIRVNVEDFYLCAKTIVKFENLLSGSIPDIRTILRHNFLKNNFESKLRKSTRLDNIKYLFHALASNKEVLYKSFDNGEESLSIMFSWLFKNNAISLKNYSTCLQSSFPQESEKIVDLQRDCHNKWMFIGKSFMKMYYSSMKSRDELFDKLCLLFNELYELETQINDELICLFKLNLIETGDVNYG